MFNYNVTKMTSYVACITLQTEIKIKDLPGNVTYSIVKGKKAVTMCYVSNISPLKLYFAFNVLNISIKPQINELLHILSLHFS